MKYEVRGTIVGEVRDARCQARCPRCDVHCTVLVLEYNVTKAYIPIEFQELAIRETSYEHRR